MQSPSRTVHALKNRAPTFYLPPHDPQLILKRELFTALHGIFHQTQTLFLQPEIAWVGVAEPGRRPLFLSQAKIFTRPSNCDLWRRTPKGGTRDGPSSRLSYNHRWKGLMKDKIFLIAATIAVRNRLFDQGVRHQLRPTITWSHFDCNFRGAYSDRS
jgi:hypothetical protein